MDQKQNHRAPKLRYSQCVYQEDISAATPKVISFHKEDQVVEEKQSYAMVTGFLRVLVHMQNPEPKRLPLISSFAIKVATIAYQRNLFPSTCFEMGLPSATRAEALGSYDQVDARPNRTSSDDEMAHFATALAQRDQPLIVLAPGKMAGVDGLLAWLDEIFKGLLDRSLDGVQFSIYGDKSRPSKVLELYTFSFHYRNGTDGERRLMGLTAPGHGNGTITVRSAISGMVNAIDQLHGYQQQLPVLPKERYLMCHLFHSPYTPRHHRPPGFHPSTDTSMAIIENGLWCMRQRSFNSIDTGIHRMCLEIGYMARTEAAKTLEDWSLLAQNMNETRVVRRTPKLDLGKRFDDQATLPTGAQITKRPRESFPRVNEQRDSINLEGMSQGNAEHSGKLARVIKQITSPGSLGKDSRQSVTMPNMLSDDSLTPTQIMMQTRDPPAPLTWNWKLRAGKEMEMAVKTDKQQWTGARDGQTTRCECSCDGEEWPMLQCICCQRLQHYHCYGFALETRVHEHYCYQCLLEDTHGALLGDMKSLAIFRRALWILYEKKPSSPSEFAQKLHLDGQTTQGLIRRLDEGGYLAYGRTRLSPVTTTEQTSFRSQLYQNPLTSISGFYELREDTPLASTDMEDENPRRKRIKT